MQVFTYILLGFLVVCAVSVSLSKNLMNSILIYMSYSLVMSVIWILLESPDLAITEAAVGAGITSVLFFLTLKKIHAMVKEDESTESESGEKQEVQNIKKEPIPAAQGIKNENVAITVKAQKEGIPVSEKNKEKGMEDKPDQGKEAARDE